MNLGENNNLMRWSFLLIFIRIFYWWPIFWYGHFFVPDFRKTQELATLGGYILIFSCGYQQNSVFSNFLTLLHIPESPKIKIRYKHPLNFAVNVDSWESANIKKQKFKKDPLSLISSFSATEIEFECWYIGIISEILILKMFNQVLSNLLHND